MEEISEGEESVGSHSGLIRFCWDLMLCSDIEVGVRVFFFKYAGFFVSTLYFFKRIRSCSWVRREIEFNLHEMRCMKRGEN